MKIHQLDHILAYILKAQSSSSLFHAEPGEANFRCKGQNQLNHLPVDDTTVLCIHFKCYPLEMTPINKYRVYGSAHSLASSSMIGIMMGLVKEIRITNISVLRILLLL